MIYQKPWKGIGMKPASTPSTSFKFTVSALAAVTCPPGKARHRVHDTAQPSLCYAVTASGVRTFYFCRWYKGKAVEVRIDAADKLTIDQARAAAVEHNGKLAKGIHPAAEKKAVLAAAVAAKVKATTVRDLWDSYVAHHLSNKRQRTIAEFTRIFEDYLVDFHDRPIADITRADVEALKLRIGKSSKTTANRAITIIGAMYRKRGDAFGLPPDFSPTARVDKFPEQPRERVLTVAELAKWLAAVDADENAIARDVFKMCLFTGARKRSVETMTWQALNLTAGTWKIAGAVAKNGKPLTLPLAPPALEIIERRGAINPPDSPFVFPGRNITPEQAAEVARRHAAGESTRTIAKAVRISQNGVMLVLAPGYKAKQPRAFDGASVVWKRIMERAGFTDAASRPRLHDLRRTFVTMLVERGHSLTIVSAAAGHASHATTAKHYAFASDKTVAAAVASGVTELMEEVKKAQDSSIAKVA
jgi:integrase